MPEIDLRDPLAGVAIFAAVVLDTLLLGVAILFFQGGGPEPPGGAEPSGPGGDGPFFARWGTGFGWLVCFLVMAGATTISFFPYGPLVGTIGWWAAALAVFGLTVRQTIKLTFAFALMHLLLVAVVTGLAAR